MLCDIGGTLVFIAIGLIAIRRLLRTPLQHSPNTEDVSRGN